MAIPHAYQGMPVDLRSAEGESLSEARTTALVKNNSFEAIRLVLPRGHQVCHERKVAGPVLVHCLEGRATLSVEGRTHDLPAGYWVFLEGDTPHTLSGAEDSLVLLTVMFR
jgi:quercetin dioxygenase-like cupin family protein